MATAPKITKVPLDPDELLMKQGDVQVYVARVVHSLRSMSGQSFKTRSDIYIGTVGEA